MLETDAEVNIMTRKVLNAADSDAERPRLDLVTHTGHHRPFVGVREDVPINVGDLVIRSPVFVIESGDHPLVLGVPFLNRGKFSQQYGSEDVYGQITDDSNTHTVVFSTFDPKDRANRERNDFFSNLADQLPKNTIQFARKFPSLQTPRRRPKNLQKCKDSTTPRQQRKYQNSPRNKNQKNLELSLHLLIKFLQTS